MRFLVGYLSLEIISLCFVATYITFPLALHEMAWGNTGPVSPATKLRLMINVLKEEQIKAPNHTPFPENPYTSSEYVLVNAFSYLCRR